MRLINVHTYELEEFVTGAPPYAILSHTWNPAGEITLQMYKDLLGNGAFVTNDSTRSERASECKIYCACQQAKDDNISHIWIDSCNIDKSSSAELSQAINSMYQWYKEAQICYAVLEDLEAEFWDYADKCRWFSRGWTLQELIAPPEVVFFNRHWKRVGTKAEFCKKLSEITGISSRLLATPLQQPLEMFSVAERMSWASKRETTRIEDTAYCLLGLFGVNMPLIYGEGEKAFVRLQEEIVKSSSDDSLFAWSFQDVFIHDPTQIPPEAYENGYLDEYGTSMFAKSPEAFRNSHRMKEFTPYKSTMTQQPYSTTNRGLDIQLPLVSIPSRWEFQKESGAFLALLNCAYEDSNGAHYVGIFLQRQGLTNEYHRIGGEGRLSTVPVEPAIVAHEIISRRIRVGIRTPGGLEGTRRIIFVPMQVVVHRSKEFIDLGYTTIFDTKYQLVDYGDEREWNDRTSTLHLPLHDDLRDPILFTFKSVKGNPAFSLIAFYDSMDKQHHIRFGPSEEYRRELYESDPDYFELMNLMGSSPEHNTAGSISAALRNVSQSEAETIAYDTPNSIFLLNSQVQYQVACAIKCQTVLSYRVLVLSLQAKDITSLVQANEGQIPQLVVEQKEQAPLYAETIP